MDQTKSLFSNKESFTVKAPWPLDGKVPYKFSAPTWQHSSPGDWYFVSLPMEMAEEIRTNLKWQEEGWSRLKAIAQIGHTKWETAIWFDT